MQQTPVPGAPAHEARRRSRLRWAIALAALVAVAVAAFLALRPAPKAEPKAKVAVPLDFLPSETARPVRATMPLRVVFSGPLVAPRTAVVRAKAPGTLLSLAVAEGQRVRAGQPIGQLDLSEWTTRIADRSAGVESAEANALEAERQHKANVELSQQNFISATALQTSKARLDAAQAQLRSARAQLAGSQVGMREAALAAPIAGIVGKRHALPGEKVSAEQMLLTIVDLSALELVGAVGTHEVSLLKPGMPVTVKVEGGAEPIAGRIDRIAPQAEAGSRSISVVVALDNRAETFRAGQYAEASVVVPDATERTVVPAQAIGQASGQDFVWTIENGALVRRIVVVGRRDRAQDRVEIVRGLAPDATLLALRFDGLREGAPARVVAARDPAASGASAAGVPQRPASAPVGLPVSTSASGASAPAGS
jgi:membrane fusion protein (multidrug efflux system)